MKKIIFIPFILIFISCSSTIRLSSEGGLGESQKNIDYPQKLKGIEYFNFNNTIVKLIISRDNKLSPIEPKILYIYDIMDNEISSNGGKILRKKDDIPDISIHIVLSKNITRNFGSEYFKTFIDAYVKIYESTSNKIITEKTISISGNGKNTYISNSNALVTFIQKVLFNDKIKLFIQKDFYISEHIITHNFEKFSSILLKEFFRQLKNTNKSFLIGYVGIENDNDGLYSSQLLNALKKRWPSNFKFYSRDQLEIITNEQALYLSGLFNSNAENIVGKLEKIDFLLVGQKSKLNDDVFVGVKLIDIKSAEIILSKTAKIFSN